MFASLLLIVLTTAEPSLGTPLKHDGYTVRPPADFRVAREELFRGTRVGAVALDPRTDRWLSAALMDGEDESAATMLISWVEGGFTPGPSTRDAFATAVVRHFSDELGMKLALETVRVVEEPAARVEVLGTLRQQEQVRRVVIAAYEGSSKHAVITFSLPGARFDALRPELDASLDTFRIDPTATSGISRGLVGAIAGAALGALLVSVGLWRNRQKKRE